VRSGAALVGGTASVLGGGKFANGAQTAAIQYLFNQASLQLAGRGLQQRANELQTRYEEIRALEINHTLDPQIYIDFNRDYYNLRDAIHTYHGLLGVERAYVQLQAAPFQVIGGAGIVRAGVSVLSIPIGSRVVFREGSLRVRAYNSSQALVAKYPGAFNAASSFTGSFLNGTPPNNIPSSIGYAARRLTIGLLD